MNIQQIDDQFIANTYHRFPIQIVRGNGAELFDKDGKRYIDSGSGIAVNTFGVGDESWKSDVISQLNKVQHTSNYYYTEPCAKLAEMLCDRTGMKKVFFSNSGAEANECAIKAARRYAFLKYGDESHHNIITLKNSFHGRTITTLSATGQDAFHKEFGPFTPGFIYTEPENIEQLKQLVSQYQCTAIMLEVIQGEGGVCQLSQEYINAIKKLAKEKQLLIIVDEVQTGNGRTGKLYGYMHYGLQPDIISTAKGLAGGLPIGATLLGEKVQNALGYGTHGSTFGGNPISCAAAVNILSRIDEALMEQVQKKSNYIKKELSYIKGVVEISGLGLMLGIKTNKPADKIIMNCMEKGVLILSAKDKLRLLPPLNISFSLLEEAITILKEEILR